MAFDEPRQGLDFRILGAHGGDETETEEPAHVREHDHPPPDDREDAVDELGVSGCGGAEARRHEHRHADHAPNTLDPSGDENPLYSPEGREGHEKQTAIDS